MKIVTIEDEKLIFDDGSVLMSTHDQDCCEWHWLDFSIMKLYNVGVTTGKPIDIYQQEFDFSHGVTFKKVEDIGIILLDAEENKYLICGYGNNNGYYGTNLDLVYIDPSGQEVCSYDITECQEVSD